VNSVVFLSSHRIPTTGPPLTPNSRTFAPRQHQSLHLNGTHGWISKSTFLFAFYISDHTLFDAVLSVGELRGKRSQDENDVAPFVLGEDGDDTMSAEDDD
jgi:hypothetical protein